jgi:cytochrome b subunit of formate dehydrogenase
MRPRVQDLRDAAQMVRYWLGRSAHRPAFDRFGYVEKIEYWALVWGSLIMTATGFALWFENISLRYLPKWGLDLATVVHYYEAWLATLAILVWHFYWVIFNPAVYPMSLVWLTGRLSEEEMAHEHPRELDRLQKPDGSRGACN